MLDQSRDFRSRRRRIVDRSEEGMGPTRNGRTNVEHLHAIAARGDPRLLGEVRAHFQRARNLSAEVKFPWRDRAPWRGAETGGATMNKAVMKLPLMLGVVGAIAFAAATPSWAAEQKGPNRPRPRRPAPRPRRRRGPTLAPRCRPATRPRTKAWRPVRSFRRAPSFRAGPIWAPAGST